MNPKSRLQALLEAGEFVVCGEMNPPLGADPEAVTRLSRHFAGFVDSVNLTDNASAIVRMSSAAASALLVQLGLEPIMQLTCRDRNRLAQQSEILGAAALGVRNLLCLTGDHQSLGNHPQARNVFDLDAVQLVHMVRRMRDEGKFQCGEEIKAPPQLFIGAAANPFADPFEFRVVRLANKIAAGAEFIQTQSVFDVPRFTRWMELVRDRGLDKRVHIIAGVMPVRSWKALDFMKKNVAGMSIPEELIARMKGAAEPKEEGVRLCVETIQQLRAVPGVRGVHIMPVNWEAIMPRVVEEARLLPRPTPPAPSEEAESGGP